MLSCNAKRRFFYHHVCIQYAAVKTLGGLNLWVGAADLLRDLRGSGGAKDQRKQSCGRGHLAPTSERGWYQRGQLTSPSTLLRYLVCPKFSDPDLLSSFFSLLKLAAPYLILLTLITLLMVCGDVERNPGPPLGNGYTPNASPLLGSTEFPDGQFGEIDLDHEYVIDDFP